MWPWVTVVIQSWDLVEDIFFQGQKARGGRLRGWRHKETAGDTLCRAWHFLDLCGGPASPLAGNAEPSAVGSEFQEAVTDISRKPNVEEHEGGRTAS
jgi:hypothetical protein